MIKKMAMYSIGFLRVLFNLLSNFGKFKILGIKYYFGKNVKIWTHNGGKCYFEKKNWVSDYSCFEANGGQIYVGFNNFFNTNCKITSLENIKIGDNNLFGPNVVILDHDHRYRNTFLLINQQGFEKSPVIIGSNVWICANVVVTRGVEIKDNIVVSANSVVKESLIVPGVYAGNPAKLVKEIV